MCTQLSSWCASCLCMLYNAHAASLEFCSSILIPRRPNSRTAPLSCAWKSSTSNPVSAMVLRAASKQVFERRVDRQRVQIPRGTNYSYGCSILWVQNMSTGVLWGVQGVAQLIRRLCLTGRAVLSYVAEAAAAAETQQCRT